MATANELNEAMKWAELGPKLLAALREMEFSHWDYDVDGNYTAGCPICGCDRGMHDADCKLAAVLKEADDAGF